MFIPELVERVNKLGGQYGFPADRDQNDAIDALLRLHYVYDLKATDVRKDFEFCLKVQYYSFPLINSCFLF